MREGRLNLLQALKKPHKGASIIPIGCYNFAVGRGSKYG